MLDIKLPSESKINMEPKISFDGLEFGKVFAPFMFTMKYKEGLGWYDAKIEEFHNFDISPAALVFHYGQEIFEGQKAYAWKDGRIAMFRPYENIKRMNRSADRMSMAKLDEATFMRALKLLVKYNKNYVPPIKDYSLYIRPTMIAIDPILGVRPAKEYLFFIIASPVGPYFANGFKPVKIWVSTDYVRAIPGGTGEAKTGGNYGASLKALQDAQDAGCTQVLWLDGKTRSYVEEVGTMNIFFVENGVLITPELTGSILHGITRKSIIEIAKRRGLKFEEKRIHIEHILEGVEKGTVTEAFGAGTACVVSPIGSFVYKGKEYVIDMDKMGTLTESFYTEITSIQYGLKADEYAWMEIVYDPNTDIVSKTI